MVHTMEQSSIAPTNELVKNRGISQFEPLYRTRFMLCLVGGMNNRKECRVKTLDDGNRHKMEVFHHVVW